MPREGVFLGLLGEHLGGVIEFLLDDGITLMVRRNALEMGHASTLIDLPGSLAEVAASAD